MGLAIIQEWTLWHSHNTAGILSIHRAGGQVFFFCQKLKHFWLNLLSFSFDGINCATGAAMAVPAVQAWPKWRPVGYPHLCLRTSGKCFCWILFFQQLVFDALRFFPQTQLHPSSHKKVKQNAKFKAVSLDYVVYKHLRPRP